MIPLLCSLSAAMSDSSSRVAVTSGFGQMAVIGLIGVSKSNLSNGFDQWIFTVLTRAPVQYVGTPRGRENGLIP